jgi:hypothetical protein
MVMVYIVVVGFTVVAVVAAAEEVMLETPGALAMLVVPQAQLQLMLCL